MRASQQKMSCENMIRKINRIYLAGSYLCKGKEICEFLMKDSFETVFEFHLFYKGKRKEIYSNIHMCISKSQLLLVIYLSRIRWHRLTCGKCG